MSKTVRNDRRLFIGALGILALSAWINLPIVSRIFKKSDERVDHLPPAPGFKAGQRVLMLSPHQDDETLGTGGMIQQAIAAGAQAYIVWITAGDGFEFDGAAMSHTLRPTHDDMRKLAHTRMAEAKNAARILGVPDENMYFMGFPDSDLFHLFTAYHEEPFTSPHTGANAVYLDGVVTPNAPFTGAALEDTLRKVIETVNPDIILSPAPEDFHPDHHTTSFVAMRLMAKRKQFDRLRYWVIHGGLEWPVPKGYHPNLPMTVPPLATRLPWMPVDLTPEQQAVKRRAIEAYPSQLKLLGRLMQAFDRTNELISLQPVPNAEIGRPPLPYIPESQTK